MHPPNEERANFTIHIDPEYHRALRRIAIERRVHLSMLYEKAVEEYLERETAIHRPRPVEQIRQLK